jgi:hypothetical protein
MPKNLSSFIFTLLFFSNYLFAQDLPPIQLDRPDQTECPFITPKNFIQIENGFTIENPEKGIMNFSYPTTLWKYGVNEKFELRLITEIANDNKQTGIKPITVGFKTSLFEENGIIPKTSFIGHVTTAEFGSKVFHTNYIAPSFRFTMQHTLSEIVALAYNLGAEWDGESPNQTYIYTLTTGISLTSKMGCYAEIYGFLPNEGKPDHRIDGGLTYLLSNNFILDISGGVGITNNAPKNYASFGVSYRFKTIK